MKPVKILILPLLFVLNSIFGFSQTLKVGICTQFKDAETLQVLITPTEDFEGMVSNIQFTLISQSADSISFGEIQLVDSAVVGIPIQKAGDALWNDSLHYQKFVGFGDKTLKSLGQKWEKGKELVLFEVPILSNGNKSSIIKVGNDSQTNDVIFNGMFYVECNFREVTGEIGGCKKNE